MYNRTLQVQWLMKVRKLHPDQETREQAENYIDTLLLEERMKPSERKLDKDEVVNFINVNKLATLKKM